MPNLNDLLMQVDENFDDLLSLHRDLVVIPSVNTGVMPTGNETEVADFARQWLGVDGIEAEIIESAPHRGNLIARLPGESGKNKLLLMSHMDVVPVEDESKWNANSTTQWGETHLVYPINCFIVYKDEV